MHVVKATTKKKLSARPLEGQRSKNTDTDVLSRVVHSNSRGNDTDSEKLRGINMMHTKLILPMLLLSAVK